MRPACSRATILLINPLCPRIKCFRGLAFVFLARNCPIGGGRFDEMFMGLRREFGRGTNTTERHPILRDLSLPSNRFQATTNGQKILHHFLW